MNLWAERGWAHQIQQAREKLRVGTGDGRFYYLTPGEVELYVEQVLRQAVACGLSPERILALASNDPLQALLVELALEESDG